MQYITEHDSAHIIGKNDAFKLKTVSHYWRSNIPKLLVGTVHFVVPSCHTRQTARPSIAFHHQLKITQLIFGATLGINTCTIAME